MQLYARDQIVLLSSGSGRGRSFLCGDGSNYHLTISKGPYYHHLSIQLYWCKISQIISLFNHVLLRNCFVSGGRDNVVKLWDMSHVFEQTSDGSTAEFRLGAVIML